MSRAFHEAIDSHDPRAFRDLYYKHREWRQDLTKLVTWCLEALIHSSVDEDGTLKVLWIPQPDKRARIRLKQSPHSWTNFLTDSEDSCFFGVMSGKCLRSDYKYASQCHCLPGGGGGAAKTPSYTLLETALVINDSAPKPKDLRLRSWDGEKVRCLNTYTSSKNKSSSWTFETC